MRTTTPSSSTTGSALSSCSARNLIGVRRLGVRRNGDDLAHLDVNCFHACPPCCRTQPDRARLLVVRALARWALVIALVIGLIAFLVLI